MATLFTSSTPLETLIATLDDFFQTESEGENEYYEDVPKDLAAAGWHITDTNSFPLLLAERESDTGSSSPSDEDSEHTTDEDTDKDTSEAAEDDEGDEKEAASSTDDDIVESEDTEDDSDSDDEAATICTLIKQGIKDMLRGENMVHGLSVVFRGLGCNDADFESRILDFAADTELLYDEMGIKAFILNAEEAGRDMSFDELDDLWRVMDGYIENMWDFIAKHENFPPFIEKQVEIVEGLRMLDCWREDMHDEEDERPSYEDYIDLRLGDVDNLHTLLWSCCANPTYNEEGEMVPEDDRGRLKKGIEAFREVSNDCKSTMKKFADDFPELWEKVSVKDGFLDEHVALWEVRKEQSNSTELVFPKRKFELLVREELQEYYITHGPREFREIEDEAIEALQVAAEEYLTELFTEGIAVAATNKRACLMPPDLSCTRRPRLTSL